VLTYLVHWFFIYRVFILSQKNYFIAAPLGLIASARLCFACLTTSKLIELGSLNRFVERFTWSFTTGLSLSAALDVLITGFMCYLLRSRRKEFSHMNQLLDTLILYAFENGVLTTLAASLTLITWLTMPHGNLIFMATHFVILKFYANSLLVTINARRKLKESRQFTNGRNMVISQITGDEIFRPPRPIVLSEPFRTGQGGSPNKSFTESENLGDEEMKMPHIQNSNLKVNVNTTTFSISDPESTVATPELTRPRASRP